MLRYFYLDADLRPSMMAEGPIQAENFIEVRVDITAEEEKKIKEGEEFKIEDGKIVFLKP